MSRIIKVLLLTNRDSDNVGDQFIEANDISLIKAAFKNLGLESDSYEIISRDASIISQEYVLTGNPELIRGTRELIKNIDIVFFGGAPLFNYLYQIFYERTAKTLELAREFNKPVIFSSIGIEGYDEDNPKCQRLKETLNFDIVKSITTRDGFDLLEKYKSNPALVIDKVCDPAVFTRSVFRDYIHPNTSKEKKKVGVFIIRANAFKDNKYDFSSDQAKILWKDIITELSERGYDYELLTSGHFGDEAFMDKLIRERIIPSSKSVFCINSPEDLISHYSDFDGVISCRLHPSILSYSMEIPSVGLVWNPKVQGFYDSMDHSDRAIDVSGLSARNVVDALEKAMLDGVHLDQEYMMSIYRNIYHTLKGILSENLSMEIPSSDIYSFNELLTEIPVYPGTSPEEKQKKLIRKFRRTYRKYNELFDTRSELKKEVKIQKQEVKALKKEVGSLKKQLNASFMRRVKRKLKKLMN